MKVDKTKEDKLAENKRNELLKFLNASYDWWSQRLPFYLTRLGLYSISSKAGLMSKFIYRWINEMCDSFWLNMCRWSYGLLLLGSQILIISPFYSFVFQHSAVKLLYGRNMLFSSSIFTHDEVLKKYGLKLNVSYMPWSDAS